MIPIPFYLSLSWACGLPLGIVGHNHAGHRLVLLRFTTSRSVSDRELVPGTGRLV